MYFIVVVKCAFVQGLDKFGPTHLVCITGFSAVNRNHKQIGQGFFKGRQVINITFDF